MIDDAEIAELAAGNQHEKLSVLARRCETNEEQGQNLSPSSMHTIYRALQDRNEHARAERWLDKLLPHYPRDVTLLNNKGRLCLMRSDWATAVPYYERALEQSPGIASVKAALGLCKLRLAEFDAAVELYESALAAEPDQKYWWIYLGQARVGVGRQESALEAYRRALEFEPNESVQIEIEEIERRLREGLPAPVTTAAAPVAPAADAAAAAAPRTPPPPPARVHPFDPGQLDLAMFGTSVIPSYRDYIQVFIDSGRKSILMRELAAASSPGTVYAHRHDVDHSLEFAYMMASIEAARGVVATYYMLHPGDYGSLRNYYGWIDGDIVRHSGRLAYVCKAMRDMGHEIGLHNNFAQLSLQTGVPAAELIRRELEYFDSIGVRVVGSASHGSDFARRNRFTNYEIFRECRSASAEFGRTVVTTDTRPDGSPHEMSLHGIALDEVGMHYEAYFLPYSLYLSDTGSRFTISGVGASSSLALPAPGTRPVSLAAVAQALEMAPGAAVSLVHADWWRSTNYAAHGAAWLNRIA